MDPCKHKAKSTHDLLWYRKKPLECAICHQLCIPEKKSWRKMGKVSFLTAIAAEFVGIPIGYWCMPYDSSESFFYSFSRVLLRLALFLIVYFITFTLYGRKYLVFVDYVQPKGK